MTDTRQAAFDSFRNWIITTLVAIEEMEREDDPPPVWQRQRAANGRFVKKEQS